MKVLIVGSAKSAKQITNHPKLDTFDRIYAINNAWVLVPRAKTRWCYSSDFFSLGTLLPPPEEQKQFIEATSSFASLPYWYDHSVMQGGVMILNTAYHVINTNPHPLQIFFIGCDLDYSNKTETHFYGLGKFTKDVYDQLAANTPELAGVAADPLRFGTEPIQKELVAMLHIPQVQLFTLSPNPNQLLPFTRVNLEDLPDAT